MEFRYKYYGASNVVFFSRNWLSSAVMSAAFFFSVSARAMKPASNWPSLAGS